MIQNQPIPVDIRQIAASQKWIIRLIVVNFSLVVLYMTIGKTAPALVTLLQLLSLANAAASIYYVYKLATALRRFAIGYAICELIPLVSFLALLIINDQATKALQRNGIRVGFFGANDADLAGYAASSSPQY